MRKRNPDQPKNRHSAIAFISPMRLAPMPRYFACHLYCVALDLLP
ncbi:hypothetical protein [Puniceibacterium confluentis]|nr:hypothetical protein [Puniceibacterium confluentis]